LKISQKQSIDRSADMLLLISSDVAVTLSAFILFECAHLYDYWLGKNLAQKLFYDFYGIAVSVRRH